MCKKFLYLAFVLLGGMALSSFNGRSIIPDQSNRNHKCMEDSTYNLYTSMGLDGKISYDAFEMGLKGFSKINNKKKNILTLIDFSKPSTEKRLFVVAMEYKKILFESFCSHGKGTGDLYAHKFSNRNGSHMSSLGFYLTDVTYRGNNGFSLRLNGLEKGFNDQARARAIVIHGAKYANPEVCKNGGRLGRSWGCPAVPEKLAKPIINTIKDGSVIFVFAQQADYLNKSAILNS